MMITIKAEALRAGMLVAERGGACLEVAEVTQVGKASLRVAFARGVWVVAPAPVTVRRSSLVSVVVVDE